jgi:hypothetical protein
MEVHFTPEQEAQLVQIATKEGTDAARLVKDAALRLLEGDAGVRAVSPGSVVAEMRALRPSLNASGRRCFCFPCMGFAR